jgi:hypothetical protein
MLKVHFVSGTTQVELKSGRFQAPACTSFTTSTTSTSSSSSLDQGLALFNHKLNCQSLPRPNLIRNPQSPSPNRDSKVLV